jgi:two-component system sensor histidine kinase DegS
MPSEHVEQPIPIVKKSTSLLLGRYKRELRSHLNDGSRSTLARAESVGRAAISKGLDTLDLASLHGRALDALTPANRSPAARIVAAKKAEAFFLNVLVPIERTHRTMTENVVKLKRAVEALETRTAELTAANLLQKQEMAHRKAAEKSLRASERHHRVLLREARLMQIRLRHLSHQVLSAQEEERKEISRELHDEIVQTLTGINVQLATLKIESGVSKKRLTQNISYTQRLVEKSVNIVHQFARDLRPTLLDDLGLIPALQAYLKSFTERTGLLVRFTVFAGVEKMNNDKRTVLFRVAQAALINTDLHAAANSVSVTIKDLPQMVLMEIRDDGKSFDVAHVMDSRRNKRLGLIGMRERVEMVGGTFEVISKPGYGTTVSVRIPFKRIKNG